MTKIYTALIGDLIKSRAYQKREIVQRELQDILSKVNKKFINSIESKFVITVGDEFQGLLNNPAPAFEVFIFIREHLSPINYRAGIGQGVLTTALEEIALGMDGPCFYKARQALNQAKQEKLPLIFSGLDSTFEPYLNSLIELFLFITSKRTARQLEIIQIVKKSKNKKQAAKKLNITPAAISKSISASHYPTIENIKNDIREILANIDNSTAKEKTKRMFSKDLSYLIAIGEQYWTNKQIEVIKLFNKYHSQKKVAITLKKSEAAISKVLFTSHFKAIKRAEQKLEQLKEIRLTLKG